MPICVKKFDPTSNPHIEHVGCHFCPCMERAAFACFVRKSEGIYFFEFYNFEF